MKKGRFEKGPNKVELYSCHAQRSGDPILIAKTLKAYPRAEDLLTKPKGLESIEIFEPSKKKDLKRRRIYKEEGSSHDFYPSDKINYSIRHIETKSTRARREVALFDPANDI